MKAKLLKIVRKKVSLQERNGKYYVYCKGNLLFSDRPLDVLKNLYRYQVIGLANEIFKPKCKNKIL